MGGSGMSASMANASVWIRRRRLRAAAVLLAALLLAAGCGDSDDDDLASVGHVEAVDQAQQLGAARADQATKANNFARAHLQ